MNSWESYLSEADRATLARGKWGQRIQPGVRPAIVSIDVQNYMVGRRGEPDGEYPYSCGGIGWEAVDASKEILAAARAAGAPVLYTRFALDANGHEGGMFARKVGKGAGENAFLEGTHGAELLAEVGPQPGDFVFTKKKVSAFFGTPLLSYLTDLQVDTVIVIGGSTSNCVRATVVDASQYNFRVLVPQEAVFDRIPLSHAVSLFDMNRTYADVLPTNEVVAYLRGIAQRAAGARLSAVRAQAA
ncbi:isochorismatase family protein [Ramlibacter alkalitolerans]|uniref:Isochorismatase family protein n=1 Tax=Ramlibacter alkalitolerans TaxID=2039631 RepID=A0ABS1JJZ0_9BURK|nr:isochorismatase family protein [Ramlibacter alkalitolerans]MBL0424553.1 isochorismatase family protein [Ramlibacter alkalitolerans]